MRRRSVNSQMKNKIGTKSLAQLQADDIIATMNAQMSAFNKSLRNAFPGIPVANAVQPHSVKNHVVERSCRKCGCTEFSACYDKDTNSACYWVEEDLCSVCATPKQKQKAMVEIEKLVGKPRRVIFKIKHSKNFQHVTDIIVGAEIVFNSETLKSKASAVKSIKSIVKKIRDGEVDIIECDKNDKPEKMYAI